MSWFDLRPFSSVLLLAAIAVQLVADAVLGFTGA